MIQRDYLIIGAAGIGAEHRRAKPVGSADERGERDLGRSQRTRPTSDGCSQKSFLREGIPSSPKSSMRSDDG